MTNSYQQKIINEISKLRNKLHVDKMVFDKFLKTINNQKRLTKEEGAKKHICAFFLPINFLTSSIYLVHHIKADDWIPPGGHINKNELPIDTVKREFKEELSYKLINEKISLFDLSIKKINRPHQNCLVHYDIWYLVYIDKLSFNFLRKEFYDAGWFDFQTGLKKIKYKSYRNIIKKLASVL